MATKQNSNDSFACISGGVSPAGHTPAASLSKQLHKKRQHKYSRGGCVTCKSKKVKCDEHKPMCHRCRRLNLECGYQPFKFEHVVSTDQVPRGAKFAKIVFKNIQVAGGSVGDVDEGEGEEDEEDEGEGEEDEGEVDEGEVDEGEVDEGEGGGNVENDENTAGDVENTAGGSKFLGNTEMQQQGCNGEKSTDCEAEDDPAVEPAEDRFSRQIANMLANQEHLVDDIMEENKRYSMPGQVPVFWSGNNVSGLAEQSDPGPGPTESSETVGPGLQNFAALFFDAVPGLGAVQSKSERLPELEDTRAPDADTSASVELAPGSRFEPRRYDFLQCLARSDSKQKMDVLCESLGLTWRESVDFRSFMLNIQPTLNPFASSYFGSSTTRVLLEKARTSPYLLNAMLACGSRYLIEKLVSVRRGLARGNTENGPGQLSEKRFTINHRIRRIETDRTKYLSNCYRHLKNLLEKPERMPAEAESALLTSIILTADLSSFSDSHWSVHLKGAKQFLWDYVECGRPITDTIIISKYLLASLEISVLMMTPESLLDPSVISLPELDKAYPVPVNYAPMAQLYRLGMVQDGYREKIGPDGSATAVFVPGAFKLYLGYTDDVMSLIKAIIYARGHAAETGKVVDPLATCEIFALIAKAKKSYIMTKDAPFQIPISSRFHPYYTGVDKLRAYPSAYGLVSGSLPDQNTCWFSYFDMCNQARVDALHLYVLVSNTFMGMPPTNAHVRRLFRRAMKNFGFLVRFTKNELPQHDLDLLDRHYNRDLVLSDPADLVQLNTEDNTVILTPEKIDQVCRSELANTFKHPINYDRYVECHIDHRICMVQWCVMIFGFCSVTPSEKIIIESLLMRLLKVGIKSGRLSLEKLSRVWTLRRIRYRGDSGVLYPLHADYGNEFFRDESKGILFT
ncbi:hypothetical protein HII13_005210 [Brettanomyces bruxellensis]|nr:hypothetical protein HII13_005210 [Brettanomyces bruxellensis]